MTATYDVIALDMDGTLLTTAKTISPRTAAALRAERDAGATVLLASGRPEHGLRTLLTDLRFDLDRVVFAACNGAAVVDAVTEEVIIDRTLDPALVSRVMDVLADTGLGAMSPAGDVLWATSEATYGADYEVRVARMALRIEPRLERVPTPLHKVLVSGEAAHVADHVAELRAALRGHAEVALSSPSYLEITAPGVTKGTGLTDFCAARGIDPARTIAFGDHENDLPMLRAAGVGVAMGNAIEHVKEVADRVTGTNDADGIAAALGR